MKNYKKEGVKWIELETYNGLREHITTATQRIT